jgi:hypothetical protein
MGSSLPAYSAFPYASAELKNRLKFMVEEEKLARDVYTVLAKSSAYPKFRNIANAEQFHMDQMSMVLADYGVWNPTLNRKPGVFFNKDLSALYKTLIAKGQLSALDAIEAGIDASSEHSFMIHCRGFNPAVNPPPTILSKSPG